MIEERYKLKLQFFSIKYQKMIQVHIKKMIIQIILLLEALSNFV